MENIAEKMKRFTNVTVKEAESDTLSSLVAGFNRVNNKNGKKRNP